MGRSFVFVIGVLGLAAGTAFAQTSSRGNRVSSQNQFNSSSLNSGFGSSSFGGLGTNSFGGTGTSQFGQSSSLGRNAQQTGNQRANTARSNQNRTSSSRRTAGNRGAMQSLGEMQNASPGGFSNPQATGRTGAIAVVRVAFAASVPAEMVLDARRMQQTLAAAAPTGNRAIQVENAAGVVTLRGRVATEHEARLAAAVASLEPGVRSVRNLLQVAEVKP